MAGEEPERERERDREPREADEAADDSDPSGAGDSHEKLSDERSQEAGDTSDDDGQDGPRPPEDRDGGNGGRTGSDGGGEGPPDLSDEELQLLAFLWLLDRTEAPIAVTGFEAKQLYEQLVAPSGSVEDHYAELKEAFIDSQRDGDPLRLTATGREAASEATDMQTTVATLIAAEIAEQVPDDDVLKRLLWLADSNRPDFDWYLETQAPELEAPKQTLAVLFADELVRSHSETQTTLSDIQDLPENIQSDVASALDEPQYLKGFVTLAGEAVGELLQLESEETIYCGAAQSVLAFYLDESEADSVLAEFRQFGLTPTRNVFGIDIDYLLEQSRDQIERWLAFDQAGCRRAFESNWDLILDWQRGFRGESEAMIRELVAVGAVVPQGDRFVVRTDAANVAAEVWADLEATLEERMAGFPNVATQVAFEFDDAMAREEDIIVTLHEASYSSNQYYYPAFIKGTDSSNPEKNPLCEKVIVVPSPSEFGFEDDHLDLDMEYYPAHSSAVERPDVNLEFNVLGAVEGLDAVHEEFDSVSWTDGENPAVRAAAEILAEQDRISMDEALDVVADEDIQYLEALYTIAAKKTTDTSIRENEYDEGVLWRDVESTLQARYPSLTADEFERIRERLTEIFVDRADIDLVAFDEVDRLYQRFGDQLTELICDRIRDRTLAEQQQLSVFFTGWPDKSYVESADDLQPQFEIYHEFWFNDKPKDLDSFMDVLVETGLCHIATYVNYKGRQTGDRAVVYKGVQENPDVYQSATGVNPDTTDIGVLDSYKSDIPQLAALEYLVDNEGEAQRSDVRDTLLSIHSEAWMAVDEIDGLLTEQDEMLVLDPLMLGDIERWVTEAKHELLGDVTAIERRLTRAEISDMKLAFDDEKRLYDGHLLTKDREEIHVVVAPWLTGADADWIDSPAIVIITGGHYEPFINDRRGGYDESLVIGLDDGTFTVYRSLPHAEIADPIIEAFEADYELESREIDLEVEADASPDPTTGTPTSATTTETQTPTDESVESKTATQQAPEGVPPAGTETDVNLPGEMFKQHRGAFPGSLIRDRPVVVLLHKPGEDRFATTVQLLCRELYRHYEGGLPRGHIRGEAETVQSKIKAGGRLEFIDDTDADFFDHVRGPSNQQTNNSVSWARFRNRIQELDTQGLGFIIVQLSTDFVEEFREELEERIRPHRPQILELEPRLPRNEYANLDAYLDRAVPTAEALWGYPELHHVKADDPGEDVTFDELYTLAERRAWTHLRDGTISPIDDGNDQLSPTMVVEPHAVGEDGSSSESRLHYALKVYVVRWLIESKGCTFDSVATEGSTRLARRTDGDVIPDIQVGDTIYEIETLYGSGTPAMTLRKTVEKYREANLAPDVNIVLPAPAAFLHHATLRRVASEMEEAWNMSIRLLIPEFSSESVTPIAQLERTIQIGSEQ